MKLAVAAAAAMLCAPTSHAERSSAHVGVDVRTDLGTHWARVSAGVRACAWDATLVFDPLFALDGEHDLDALGEWYAGDSIALLLGWRWSVVEVAGGTHHQQRSLVGVTALGPAFLSGRLRTSASLELATLWVKHGGGVSADWISADRNLADHFAFGLFVRIEYAHPL